MVDAITDLCRNDRGQRVSAAAIREALTVDDSLAGLAIPSERSIRDICDATPAPDLTAVWTLASGTVDEARVVMPVLRDLVERTHGRRTFVTKQEAEVIVKVAAVAPDLPPYEQYRLARQIVAAGDSWPDAALVHHYIAFEPWRDQGERYSRAPVARRYETAYEILAAEQKEAARRRAEGDPE